MTSGMTRIRDYLFLHMSVMLFSFTSVFAKLASIQLNQGGLRNPKLYVFIFLMLSVCAVYAFFWQKVIKRFDLNIGYANRSVYLIWSQVWSVFLFHEHLNLRNVIGLVVVLTGVIIVSLNANKEEA